MFLDYLNAIRSDLDNALPKLQQCELHPGDVNEHELKRIALHCPAVLISLGMVKPSEDVGDGQRDWPLLPVIYIISKDEPRLGRFETAINLTQSILERITGNNFNIEGVGSPSELGAKNLFTGEIDRQKISMWAIRFTQKMRIGSSMFDSEGEVPSQLYVGIAPEIGAAHEQDYIEIENVEINDAEF